jgi:hypothetical protein
MSIVDKHKKSVKRVERGDDDDVFHDWRRSRAQDRRKVYRLPSVLIDPDATLTARYRRLHDRLFDERVRPRLKGYKAGEKRRISARLFAAALRASWEGGTVRYPRDLHHTSKAHLQVIDAWVAAGLLHDVRSKPGRNPYMSRLYPSDDFAKLAADDPWEFDAGRTNSYVAVQERKTKEGVPFDPGHPVAAEFRRKLELINDVNAQWEITYTPWDDLASRYRPRRRLRPVHIAKFNDPDFATGGRLYTERYGHQALQKIERVTIQFAGEPSVELDYGGLHVRMLYHQQHLPCRGDPYALWGDATTPQLRLLAKTTVNALINAKSPKAAVSACNKAMCATTNGGIKKRGKALRDARQLVRRLEGVGGQVRRRGPAGPETPPCGGPPLRDRPGRAADAAGLPDRGERDAPLCGEVRSDPRRPRFLRGAQAVRREAPQGHAGTVPEGDGLPPGGEWVAVGVEWWKCNTPSNHPIQHPSYTHNFCSDHRTMRRRRGNVDYLSDESPARFRGRRLRAMPLTGLDLAHNRCDVPDPIKESIREEVRRRGLPFGRHLRTPLDRVPVDYLRWVLDSIHLYPPLLADVVREEVRRREEDGRERVEDERQRYWLEQFRRWKSEDPERRKRA